MPPKITYVLECTYPGSDLSEAELIKLNDAFGCHPRTYTTRREIDTAIQAIVGKLEEGYNITKMRVIIYRSDSNPYVWMSRFDITRNADNEVTVKEVVYNEIVP